MATCNVLDEQSPASISGVRRGARNDTPVAEPAELKRKSDLNDHFDVLQAKAAQLHAALLQISDDGFDAFESLGRAHKDNYIWLLATLAGDVVKAADEAAIRAR